MGIHTSEQSKIIDSIGQSISNIEQVSSLCDEDYAQCLEVYESNSNQRLGLLNWLEEYVLSSMLKSSHSILSVGCGTGAFDEQVLQRLSGGVEQVDYLGIEPNDIEAAQFLKKIQAQNSSHLSVDASVLVEKFGDSSLSQDFDLILFVQSIYYLDDRNSAIDAALNALSPDGILVIIIAPDEALNTIANLIWQRQMGQDSWFSNDLRRQLDARDITYSETRVSASLNATECFNTVSQKGRDIIDFIVQTRTDDLPDSLQQDISDFLLSISDVVDGNSYLPHPVDIFRCTK
jgi:SAM-dependent methyltransferase